MMDYRNKESTEATIQSYMEAFNKMKEYAEQIEPSTNEFNQRVVLPTNWRSTGACDREKLRRDANYLHAHHANLIEIGDKPRYVAKGYWDYDGFFKVSWQLRIPFNIYAWEGPKTFYPDGFDAEGDPIGKAQHIPAKMDTWCSPQYLCLGEISSWAMKQWSLPDWRDKHDEILSFMDDNPVLKDQYQEAVGKADKHFTQWLALLGKMSVLSDTFTPTIPL